VPPIVTETDADGADFFRERIFASRSRTTSYAQSVSSDFCTPISCNTTSSWGGSSSIDGRAPDRQSKICKIASGRRTSEQYCQCSFGAKALRTEKPPDVPRFSRHLRGFRRPHSRAVEMEDYSYQGPLGCFLRLWCPDIIVRLRNWWHNATNTHVLMRV
jgi:hypothetical protein